MGCLWQLSFKLQILVVGENVETVSSLGCLHLSVDFRLNVRCHVPLLSGGGEVGIRHGPRSLLWAAYPGLAWAMDSMGKAALGSGRRSYLFPSLWSKTEGALLCFLQSGIGLGDLAFAVFHTVCYPIAHC